SPISPRRSGPRTSTSVSRTSTYRDRYQEVFRELIEVKMQGLPIEPRHCPHQYPDGRRKEERTTVGTRRRKRHEPGQWPRAGSTLRSRQPSLIEYSYSILLRLTSNIGHLTINFAPHSVRPCKLSQQQPGRAGRREVVLRQC